MDPHHSGIAEHLCPNGSVVAAVAGLGSTGSIRWQCRNRGTGSSGSCCFDCGTESLLIEVELGVVGGSWGR